MEVIDIFRRERDGNFSWMTSASSVKIARAIIRSTAMKPSQEFLVYDNRTDDKLILRADGCWFAAAGIKILVSNLKLKKRLAPQGIVNSRPSRRACGANK